MINDDRFTKEDGHVHFHNEIAQLTSRRQFCVRRYDGKREYFDRYSDAVARWNDHNGIANVTPDNSEVASVVSGEPQ